MIFFHHHAGSRKPHFAGWLFVILLVIFTDIIQSKLVVGLTGLGVTLLLGGALVEINAPRIWDKSIKSKKRKHNGSWWNRPTRLYYAINTYVVWPMIMALGVISLMVAYQLA